jgi:PhzF family phenazine biosynthesis protein
MKISVNIISAFSRSGKGGNLAGVVLSADFITDTEMQAIAKKAGFSETAFFLQTDKADFRLRYFTPATEVPLCGHATIAAFGLLKNNGSVSEGKHMLQTKAGMLQIEVQKSGIVMMDQNLPVFYETIDKNEIADSLDIPPEMISIDLPVQIVSTGLKDIIVPIISLKELLSIEPDFEKIKHISKKYDGAGYHIFTTGTRFNSTAHARNFAPLYDIPEESATGTASGALAGYMFRYGIIKEDQAQNIIFEQGYSMNKPSEIFASLIISNGNIAKVRVGGKADVCGKMEMEI